MRSLAVLALVAGTAAAGPRRLVDGPSGAGWASVVDRETGTPAWLYGGRLEVAGAVGQPAIAERAAREFLAAHAGELAPGSAASDFEVIGNTLVGDKRIVGLRQTWRGLPVIGAEIGFVFARDRLMAVASRARPHVAATGANGHAVLPVAGGYRVVDLDERGEYTVYVDPASRAEVGRTRNYADSSGKLAYDVGARYGTGPRTQLGAPEADITVGGAATTTGGDGSFTWTGAGSAALVPGLSGPAIAITNQAGALATASLTAQPGQTTTWSLATDEVGDAQLSTFIYASIAKARARVINPAASAWLDQPFPVFVNEPGACNAFTTMNDLHFFRASADCNNTGRVSDIVQHEFGHALHLHSIIPGMGAFDQALSEGLADFNAANLTGDPNVGRGLYYDDHPVRELDPYGREMSWPRDVNYDVHVTGEIISGALWDLRKRIGVPPTERIFAGLLQNAADIPSTYMAALVADDDDANLANGTPHYCDIQRAFGAHGLAGSDYQPTLVAPPIVDGTAITVQVTTPTQIGACPIAHVTDVTVTWQPGTAVGGSFHLTAAGDTWTGAFPDVPENTIVTYSVDATLDDGSHVVLPDNPADPMYQRFVGTAREIYCERFDGANPHWAQTGNLGDEWQWGPLFVPPTATDPQAAHSPPNVWGTKLDSTGNYQPNEVTSTSTPVIDVSSYEIVHLQYWRWLAVEDATYDQVTIQLDGQRAWGNPTSKAGTLDLVDREWRFHDLDATPFISPDGTLQVTWTLASDSSNELGGWTLDDVCFVGLDKHSVCGDHVVDDGEQCDDGNTANGDGCSSTCKNEIIAGGGGGCATSNGDAGALLAAAALYARASRSRRRAARSSSGMLSART